jgi:hypothetical protein
MSIRTLVIVSSGRQLDRTGVILSPMTSALTDAAPPAPGVTDAPLSVSAPGATYDDVFDALNDFAEQTFNVLNDISERLKRVESFCNDVQTAVNSMPALPFMPKFPKVGVRDGG